MIQQLKIRSAAPLAAALRYLTMVEAEATRPILSRAEWLAVCDAMPEDKTVEESGDPQALAGRIPWVDRLNGLGERWGIDATALAHRLQEMPKSEQVAVIDIVERFWDIAAG